MAAAAASLLAPLSHLCAQAAALKSETGREEDGAEHSTARRRRQEVGLLRKEGIVAPARGFMWVGWRKRQIV